MSYVIVIYITMWWTKPISCYSNH